MILKINPSLTISGGRKRQKISDKRPFIQKSGESHTRRSLRSPPFSMGSRPRALSRRPSGAISLCWLGAKQPVLVPAFRHGNIDGRVLQFSRIWQSHDGDRNADKKTKCLCKIIKIVNLLPLSCPVRLGSFVFEGFFFQFESTTVSF